MWSHNLFDMEDFNAHVHQQALWTVAVRNQMQSTSQVFLFSLFLQSRFKLPPFSHEKKKTFQLPRNNICGKFFKIMYQLPRNLANLNICRFSMLDILRDKNCTIWPPKCRIKHLPTVHKRLPYLNTVLK